MKILHASLALFLSLAAPMATVYAAGGDTIRAHIVNRNSGKVLDEDIETNKVQQWRNYKSLNQTWTFFEFEDYTVDIINNQTGNCLEIDYDVVGLDPNGRTLRTAPCNGTPQQRFRLEAVLVGNPGGISGSDGYRLRSVTSGQCVDVENHSKKNGARVQQWGCHDALNQRWDLTIVPQ